jgi:hypothetical protein
LTLSRVWLFISVTDLLLLLLLLLIELLLLLPMLVTTFVSEKCGTHDVAGCNILQWL